MKQYWLTIVAAGAILAMSGSVAMAQDSRQQGGQNRPVNTQFDDHAQQIARDWNNQHQKNRPPGFEAKTGCQPSRSPACMRAPFSIRICAGGSIPRPASWSANCRRLQATIVM